MDHAPTDERLKAISEATCLCSNCEPDLAPVEVRPMAVELLALRRAVAALSKIAESSDGEHRADVRLQSAR